MEVTPEVLIFFAIFLSIKKVKKPFCCCFLTSKASCSGAQKGSREKKLKAKLIRTPNTSSFCPRRYGPVWGQFSGIQPHLYVADPELLKDVMVKSFDAFADRQHFSNNPKVELINTNFKKI